MSPEDAPLTHRSLAAACFNSTWDLLDRSDRTPEETDEMIHRAHASYWHWTQTEGHTPQNLSVGAWQLSRVYASARIASRALHYAALSLRVAQEGDLSPFFLGYAHEALARSHALDGDLDAARKSADAAAALADRIEDDDDRKALLDDLSSLF